MCVVSCTEQPVARVDALRDAPINTARLCRTSRFGADRNERIRPSNGSMRENRSNHGLLILCLALLACCGCAPRFSERSKLGWTIYCPGAGNTDFGENGIRKGLEAAGYQGEVAAYLWTVSFNIAIDQTVRINARIRAEQLARLIEQYIDWYRENRDADDPPEPRVYLIGLSAGTGIAIWACENLRDGYMVDTVVLMSSSLSYDYDLSLALRRIRGRIYNYASDRDAVLAGPMQIVGTIDGKIATPGAGQIGFQARNHADRVVNIRWRSEFMKFGYFGGHTDATNPAFVEAYIAGNILRNEAREVLERTPAMPLAKGPRGAHPH